MISLRTASSIVVVGLFVGSASSFALNSQMSAISSRQSPICPAKHLTACSSKIPFCCPKDTICTALTPDDSCVLCCPIGQDCSVIATVSCDVALQNPNKYPGALLQTNRLHAKLPSCGQGCCPFGYNCVDGHCVLKRTITASTSSHTIPSATQHHSVSQLPTKSMQPVIIPTRQAESSAPAYPANAVVLGLFMGLLAAVVIFTLTWYILRRRKLRPNPDKGERRPPHARNTSAVGSVISEPIIASEYGGGHRTDFALRTPDRKKGSASDGLTPSPLRIGHYTDQVPPKRPLRSDEDLNTATGQAGTAATDSYADKDAQGRERRRTNESYISEGASSRDSRADRSASTGTINVLMPPPIMAEGGPNGRGVSTNTTFSVMMERAGMRRGPGFAEYPGRWSFSKK